MTLRLGRWALAVMMAVVTLITFRSAAQAQGASAPTFLTIQPIDSAAVNTQIRVDVRLTTGRGDPVVGKPVNIALTSDLAVRTNTDSDGIASFSARLDLAPGTYTLITSFDGALGLQSSRATKDVVVVDTSSTTHLVVQPLSAVGFDTNAELQARLTTSAGAPIVGARLQLYVDGVAASQGTTDNSGIAYISIGKGNALGNHRVTVEYQGTKEFAPISQQTVLSIRPLDIEMHTSPVLEGARFLVAGKVYSTGPDGIVRIPVDGPGTYHVEVLPYEAPKTGIQAEFQSWDDGSAASYHDFKVPGTGPIQAGFNLSHQVQMTFVDLEGRPVDPRRVTSLTFKRNDGVIYDLANGDPRWLEANYLVRRLEGMEESPFLYSLQSVVVNGTNVISAQQQRFYVHPNDTWTLKLLLFSANLKAHDLMFGFPLGSSVRLEYPDGLRQNIPLNATGEGEVHSLPRGSYQVSVNTNLGIAPVSTLAMSRDQEVDLKVVSYLDLVAVLMVALALGPGLLLIGQPRLRQVIRSGAILDTMRQPFRRGAKNT